LCVCECRYYPFCGSRRQYLVARPLWVTTFPKYAAYLRDYNINVVFAKHKDISAQRLYENVPSWLMANSELFTVIYDDGQWIVANVNRALLVKKW
jgi:hypothetical protein